MNGEPDPRSPEELKSNAPSVPAQRSEPSPNPPSLTRKDLYEQGSHSCRQYSLMTKDVRTQAQTLMGSYAVAMGIILSNLPRMREDRSDACVLGFVVLGIGVLMLRFGKLQHLTNEHYSRGFRAIRASLTILEADVVVPDGSRPWTAHKQLRDREPGDIAGKNEAWQAPARTMTEIGWVTIAVGLVILLFCFVSWTIDAVRR